MSLRRYWLTFDGAADSLPIGIALGCGITATDAAAARQLVEERVFHGQELPLILEFIEDVDIATLDEDHVLPNLGNPLVAGIWFPLGY